MRGLLRPWRVPAEEREGRQVRGFLSLEPDDDTLARLLLVQNRLRDALTRQGVSFPERLGATLLTWPFATSEELSEALVRIDGFRIGEVRASTLQARPNGDRPAELGFSLEGVEVIQSELFGRLRELLDPDPPKSAFVRLARVSPPSRKVGAALHGSGLLGDGVGPFRPAALALWRQTPEGFAISGTVALSEESS